MDFIKVSVDNSCKIISYHLWSNRARTLLTPSFTTLILPIESRESIHSSTGTCLYSWSNSMIHWAFPSPLSFLLALPASHAISPFWLYTGKSHFWVKVSISWIKTNRAFYVAHLQKIAHLLVQTPSQLGDHIFPRYKHIHLTEILMTLSFDKKLKKHMSIIIAQFNAKHNSNAKFKSNANSKAIQNSQTVQNIP